MTNLEELKKHDAEYIATQITDLFHKKCPFPWFVMGDKKAAVCSSAFDFYLVIKNFLEEEKK